MLSSQTQNDPRYQQFSTAAIRALNYRDIRQHIQPGQFGCLSCGHVAQAEAFENGRGKDQGEHPDFIVCPNCEEVVGYTGFVDGHRPRVIVDRWTY